MSLCRVKQEQVYYYFKRYSQEIVESFVAFTVYNFLIHRKFDLKKSSYMGLGLGFVTLILEEYDHSYKELFKNGIIMAIGSQVIKF